MAVTRRWKNQAHAAEKGGRKRFSETWDVDATEGVTDRTSAIAAVPEAAIGQGHWEHGAAVVVNHGATQERFNLWAVTADYETPDPDDAGGGDRDPDENENAPLDPPRWSWTEGSVTYDVDVDFDGNPLLNAALDGLEPVPRDFPTAFLTLVRHEQGLFDGRGAQAVRDHVNNDTIVTPFGTFNPLECKLISRRPAEEYRPGMNRLRVATTIEIRLLESYPFLPENISPFDLTQQNKGLNGWGGDDTATKGRFSIPFDGPVSFAIRLDERGVPYEDNYLVRMTQEPVAAPNQPTGAAFSVVGESTNVSYKMCGRAGLGSFFTTGNAGGGGGG